MLVAVISDKSTARQTEEYLDELEFLAETADIITNKAVYPENFHTQLTYISRPGKLQELALYCKDNEVDVAIFDDELSPSQQRNIEKELPCRILDRTSLILDIFMNRAKTGLRQDAGAAGSLSIHVASSGRHVDAPRTSEGRNRYSRRCRRKGNRDGPPYRTWPPRTSKRGVKNG